jgi:hypothetical protein
MTSFRPRSLQENVNAPIVAENEAAQSSAAAALNTAKATNAEQVENDEKQLAEQSKLSKVGDFGQLLQALQQKWEATDRTKPLGARLVQLARQNVPGVDFALNSAAKAKQVAKIAAAATQPGGAENLIREALPDRLKPLAAAIDGPGNIKFATPDQRAAKYTQLRDAFLKPALEKIGVAPEQLDLATSAIVNPQKTATSLIQQQIDQVTQNYVGRSPDEIANEFLSKNFPDYEGANDFFTKAKALGIQAEALHQQAVDNPEFASTLLEDYPNQTDEQRQALLNVLQATTPEDRASAFVAKTLTDLQAAGYDNTHMDNASAVLNHPVVNAYLQNTLSPEAPAVDVQPLLRQYVSDAIDDPVTRRVLEGTATTSDYGTILNRVAPGLTDKLNSAPPVEKLLQDQFKFKNATTALAAKQFLENPDNPQAHAALADAVLTEGIAHLPEKTQPVVALGLAHLREGYKQVAQSEDTGGFLDQLRRAPAQVGAYLNRQVDAAREEAGLGASDVQTFQDQVRSTADAIRRTAAPPFPSVSKDLTEEPLAPQREYAQRNIRTEGEDQNTNPFQMQEEEEPRLPFATALRQEPYVTPIPLDPEDVAYRQALATQLAAKRAPVPAAAPAELGTDLIAPKGGVMDAVKASIQQHLNQTVPVPESERPLQPDDPEAPFFVDGLNTDQPTISRPSALSALQERLSKSFRPIVQEPPQATTAPVRTEVSIGADKGESIFPEDEPIAPRPSVLDRLRSLMKPAAKKGNEVGAVDAYNPFADQPKASDEPFSYLSNVAAPEEDFVPKRRTISNVREAYQPTYGVDENDPLTQAYRTLSRTEMIKLRGGFSYTDTGLKSEPLTAEPLVKGVVDGLSEAKESSVAPPSLADLKTISSADGPAPEGEEDAPIYATDASNAGGARETFNEVSGQQGGGVAESNQGPGIQGPSYAVPAVEVETTAPQTQSNTSSSAGAAGPRANPNLSEDFQLSQQQHYADISDTTGLAQGGDVLSNALQSKTAGNATNAAENAAENAAKTTTTSSGEDAANLLEGAGEVGTAEFDPVGAILGAAQVATSLYGLFDSPSKPPTPPPYYEAAPSIQALAANQIQSNMQQSSQFAGVQAQVEGVPQNTNYATDGEAAALASEE